MTKKTFLLVFLFLTVLFALCNVATMITYTKAGDLSGIVLWLGTSLLLLTALIFIDLRNKEKR